MGFFRRRRRDPLAGPLLVLERHDWVADTQGQLIDLAVGQRIAAVHRLAEIDLPGARDGLIRALLDTDSRVRSAALEALVAARDGHAVVVHAEALVADTRRERLTEEDEHAVRRLATAAEDGAEAELARRLLPALASPDPATRGRAQQVLAVLPDEGVQLLVAQLSDPATREHAAATLGEMRELRAVPALIAVLEGDDTPARVAAARALGAIRDPQAAEPLMRASADADPAVRDAAQESMDRLGMMGVVVGVAQLVQPLVQRVEQLERTIERSALPPAASDSSHASDDGEEEEAR